VREEDAYQLQKQLKRLYRRVQRELPGHESLSYSAQQVLAALEHAGTALRPGDLARELQMASSNVAATLRSLEAAALVDRRRDPEDGRGALVSLTQAGVKLISEARREKLAWLQRAAAAILTPEEQQLLLRAGHLMQRLADHA
jgi:DNA-binding MarR family transcriptional regulator